MKNSTDNFPKRTPPLGELNTRGAAEYSNFDPSNAISEKGQNSR